MSGPRFLTLGCRLNAYETEAMRRLAAGAGLGDAVVVNTCAVTGEAVRQARQQIRRARRERPGARLVVTGCAAQTDAAGFAALEGVDVVLGNAEKLRPEVWARVAAGTARPVEVGDIMQARRADAPLVDGLGGRARAHVQVQTGCDHRCTFCIIPYGRGNSRSVPAAQVVAQVARLAGRGFNEVVLTGVDITSWGADLDGGPQLGDLVAAVLRAVPDLPRLRLSSIDSVEADPRLVELVGGEPRLMPHLHLSLQHGSDLILKRMKRRHLRRDAIDLCARLRAARPDIVFGADLIAGFPTETDANFAETLDLVAACCLTWLHVFPYSARAGTPAARMPQLPGPEIRARAARLRALGAARAEAHLDALRGQRVSLLIERPGLGRTEGFALARLPADHAPGTVLPARITGRDGETLLAEAA